MKILSNLKDFTQHMQGISVNTFDPQYRGYPLIYGGDAPNIAGGYNSSISRYQRLLICLFYNFGKYSYILVFFFYFKLICNSLMNYFIIFN